MAKQLINKLTRELTEKEAIHVGHKIWHYALDLNLADQETAQERRQVKAEFAEMVRVNVRQVFLDPAYQPGFLGDMMNLNYEFNVDNEEGRLDLNTAMQTFNYLHKIGVLI